MPNLEYAILKSHLIIEHAIKKYIRSNSRVYIDNDKLQFTFAQIHQIAYMMGFGVNDPVIIPFSELLNKARNKVAHTFSLDRKTIDEAIRIASAGSDEFPTKNDRQRVQALRHICRWYCAYVAGYVQGDYYFMRYREEKTSR